MELLQTHLFVSAKRQYISFANLSVPDKILALFCQGLDNYTEHTYISGRVFYKIRKLYFGIFRANFKILQNAK